MTLNLQSLSSLIYGIENPYVSFVQTETSSNFDLKQNA